MATIYNDDQSRLSNILLRRVNYIVFYYVKRERKRPRIILEIVDGDVMLNNIFKNLVFNQIEWCGIIHVINLLGR